MEELRRMREEAGLTQVGLAKASGVDRGTIIKIERGQRSPTVETLAKLARAMGAEISDFFPKAQAPLWSGEAPGRRSSAFSFEEARESLERYCERWEKLLAEGGGRLDDQVLDEFFITAEGWLPILDIALSAEIAEKAATGEQPSTEIGRVNRRYLKLLSKIADTLANQIEEGHEELSKLLPTMLPPNVVRMQEYRDRALHRAVG